MIKRLARWILRDEIAGAASMHQAMIETMAKRQCELRDMIISMKTAKEPMNPQDDATHAFWNSDFCDICQTKVKRTLWFKDPTTKRTIKKCDDCLSKEGF